MRAKKITINLATVFVAVYLLFACILPFKEVFFYRSKLYPVLHFVELIFGNSNQWLFAPDPSSSVYFGEIKNNNSKDTVFAFYEGILADQTDPLKNNSHREYRLIEVLGFFGFPSQQMNSLLRSTAYKIGQTNLSDLSIEIHEYQILEKKFGVRN